MDCTYNVRRYQKQFSNIGSPPRSEEIWRQCTYLDSTQIVVWAVVVAQLLLIPEVRSSNPVNGKIYIEHLFTVNCIVQDENNEKDREWPSFLQQKNIDKCFWSVAYLTN